MTGKIRYTGHFPEVKTYFIDGQEVTEEAYYEALPSQGITPGEPPGGPALTGWPIHSDALAYHRKQIPEARAYFEKLGIGSTQIDECGRPVFTDRAHQRQVLKALGKHSNNAYGRN